jgi:hypothetical protein
MSAVLQTLDALTSLVVSGVVRLAQDPVPAEDQVRPGWIALGLMVLMCVATFLLWMNMRKQIGKIDFDESDPAEDAEPVEGDEKSSPAAPSNGSA